MEYDFKVITIFIPHVELLKVTNILILAKLCPQALDTFNTAVVSPIYYVMFTSLTILASVIMFKVTISMCHIGFFVVLYLGSMIILLDIDVIV